MSSQTERPAVRTVPDSPLPTKSIEMLRSDIFRGPFTSKSVDRAIMANGTPMSEPAQKVWEGYMPTAASLRDDEWPPGTQVTCSEAVRRTLTAAFSAGIFHDYELWTNGTGNSILVGVIFFSDEFSNDHALHWYLGRTGSELPSFEVLHDMTLETLVANTLWNRWSRNRTIGVTTITTTVGVLLGYFIR